MNLLEKVIAALSGTMQTPTPYGWFHLLSFSLMIIGAALIIIFLRKTTDKQNKIVLLVFSVTCILFEVYKQLQFSFSADTGVWDYQWYAFPFQFCSTPMIVAFVALFMKKGKVKTSLYSYLATFGLFGGLIVMFVPGDVFVSTIGINIQTMYHHATQVLIGVYLIASKRVKISLKTPFKALPTFLALVAIALTLNITMVNFTNGETFNMFFIGPNFPSSLPVFDQIYQLVPHSVFVMIYIFAFTLGVYLVYLPAVGIKALYTKHKAKKAIEKTAPVAKTNKKEKVVLQK